MEPEDLRIGNWFFYKGKDVQWSIEDFAEWGKNIEKLIEPILITPEWLERFGFEKKPIHWEGAIDLMADGDEWNFESGYIDINIKYVHQLQNLYYALTGKELEKK